MLEEGPSDPRTVGEIMTRWEDCVTEENTIAELARTVVDLGKAAVVVRDGAFLGAIGAARLARAVAAGTDPEQATLGPLLRNHSLPQRQVQVPADTPVDQAHALMVLEGTDHLLVTAEGELLGIVLRSAIDSYRDPMLDGVPAPPESLMRLVVGDELGPPRAIDFVLGGARTAEAIRTVLRAYDRPIERAGAVLDFGCGCGRVIRHLKELPDTRLFGCDYNPDLIAWCRANLPFAEYATNGLEPGLEYADDSFGLVYALSVFTHLPEEMQLPWMAELYRVVKPGGTLLVTVVGASRIASLGKEDADAFRAGELVATYATQAGTNRCAVFHPREYVEQVFSTGFELVAYVPDAAFGMRQDIVLLAKA
jgi:SAM-dependent methyltransferase/CBS domain-containing protein